MNLKPEQMSAWDTWSAGVQADAKEQLKKGNDEDNGAGAMPSRVNQTTPQRMARGIERLRAETQWMQAHLVRLDAAQVRTKTLYDTLSREQQTIFDLFWTVMHHRSCAIDGWQMPMHPLSSPMDENCGEAFEQ